MNDVRMNLAQRDQRPRRFLFGCGACGQQPGLFAIALHPVARRSSLVKLRLSVRPKMTGRKAALGA